MLFKEAPPDTSAYMVAGFTVFFVISLIYVLSLAIRRRNLEQDLKTLESIETGIRATPAGQRASAPTTRRGRSRGRAAARPKQARRKVTRRK